MTLGNLGIVQAQLGEVDAPARPSNALRPGSRRPSGSYIELPPSTVGARVMYERIPADGGSAAAGSDSVMRTSRLGSSSGFQVATRRSPNGGPGPGESWPG